MSLFNKADLPDSAPAGATWDPFVRGWREEDYYIVALTEADNEAIRPGMIATRMFAVPLEEAVNWDNIEALFELLHDTSRTYLPELTISFDTTKGTHTVPSRLLGGATNCL